MIRIQHNLAIAWLVVAAALFMRAAVPAGWMPEQSNDGSIIAQVCNSGITIEIPLERGDTAPLQSDHQSPCAFSGFAHGAPLASLIGLGAVALAPQAISPAILERFELGIPPRARPPGRAPPVMG